jgi:hypothetical protein
MTDEQDNLFSSDDYENDYTFFSLYIDCEAHYELDDCNMFVYIDKNGTKKVVAYETTDVYTFEEYTLLEIIPPTELSDKSYEFMTMLRVG